MTSDQKFRYFCFDCASPWPDIREIQCLKCKCTNRTQYKARPKLDAPTENHRFDGPWKHLPWPTQGCVCIWGGPGAGKSSLAALIKPLYWFSKEQYPQQTAEMIKRMTPDHMPTLVDIENADELDAFLNETLSGPIVIDSISAFPMKDGMRVTNMLLEWSKKNNQRVLAILQANSSGGSAGKLEIPHMFDVEIEVNKDVNSIRLFTTNKSRWCALYQVYYAFNRQGKIVAPDFPAAYTVEQRRNGGYYLHAYPMKGAKWDGLCAIMSELQILKPQMASAAMTAAYMPEGFLEPPDVIERKRFAEDLGMKWISPKDLLELIPATPSEETKK